MPYKDKAKQLECMRKYQSGKAKKLKEVEELEDIKKQSITLARQHLVGRQIYSLKLLPNDAKEITTRPFWVSKIPINHENVESPITSKSIEDATMKIVKAEDTILLTGEHTGWSCLGIEGLATATNRNIVSSCGDLLKDLEEASKQLEQNNQYPPYAVICSAQLGLLPFTQVYISDCLFNGKGEQNNMLVVKPNSQNFELLVLSDMDVSSSNGKYVVWEAVAPNIINPKAICEIQGIG